MAQVAVKAQVQCPAWHSGLKDPALLQLWLGFNSWPREPHVPWVQSKKKERLG